MRVCEDRTRGRNNAVVWRASTDDSFVSETTAKVAKTIAHVPDMNTTTAQKHHLSGGKASRGANHANGIFKWC